MAKAARRRPWARRARISWSRYLDRKPTATIGTGWGKSLSSVADTLLRRPRPGNRFVSILGSLTRHAAANPYDVIHQLTGKTGAEGFIMPVPFIADAVADRALLMGQKSVGKILDLAKQADLYMLGIGGCGPESSAFESGHITKSEEASLRAAGAVGDLLGRFFDLSGRVVDCEFNDRVLASIRKSCAAMRSPRSPAVRANCRRSKAR